MLLLIVLENSASIFFISLHFFLIFPSRFVSNPVEVVGCLLQSGVNGLPAHIQAAYLQSALKLFSHVASGGVKSTKPPETTVVNF